MEKFDVELETEKYLITPNDVREILLENEKRLQETHDNSDQLKEQIVENQKLINQIRNKIESRKEQIVLLEGERNSLRLHLNELESTKNIFDESKFWLLFLVYSTN